MESRRNAIINALESIVKREGIVNPKIEILEGCDKGNGYGGEKNIAILQGDNKTLEVFIKSSPTNEALKNVLNPRNIFLLEIFVYNEVIPTFLKFQQEKNIPKPFNSIIDCLETKSDIDNEMILLKNAKTLGYQVWNRMDQMNRNHVELVFNEYGKFHGLSYALKDQKPDVYFGLIKRFSVNVFATAVADMVEGFLKMAKKAKLLFDPLRDADVYKSYEKFVDEYADFMINIGYQRDDYSVILHGDCWCTNMMFKYGTNCNNNTRPEEMVFLDFQLLREGSPALDLAYFLYCSASKEVYNNLDHYHKMYYNSLSETVRALGSDPDVVLPYNEWKNQWKLYAKFGLLMAVLNLKVCVQEDDEVMDFSEALEQSETANIVDGFCRKSKNEAIYEQRLKDLIIHMAKNEFI